MPAINSLTTTTTTIPNVASPSGNVINNSLPIISIHNSTSALLKAEPVNKFAHEIAYAAQIRHKRSDNNDICHLKDLACRPLNPIEFSYDYVDRRIICISLRKTQCPPKKP